MLFNYSTFVEELRDNPEKKEVIEKYEKFFWPIQWDLQNQIWYQEYVSTFPHLEYNVPEELKWDFDWVILMQLVGSSFSSDWLMEAIQDWLPEFLISVQSWDQVVVKKVSELWWFQILRLYEIYVEEQMNLQILIAEDEKEKEAILAQRESRFKRRNLVMEKLSNDTTAQEEDKVKSEKLDNLMDQL